MERLTDKKELGIPSLSTAACGEYSIDDKSKTDKFCNLSSLVSSGYSTYIITIPLANQRKKNKHITVPSHRWNRKSNLLSFFINDYAATKIKGPSLKLRPFTMSENAQNQIKGYQVFKAHLNWTYSIKKYSPSQLQTSEGMPTGKAKRRRRGPMSNMVKSTPIAT